MLFQDVKFQSVLNMSRKKAHVYIKTVRYQVLDATFSMELSRCWSLSLWILKKSQSKDTTEQNWSSIIRSTADLHFLYILLTCVQLKANESSSSDVSTSQQHSKFTAAATKMYQHNSNCYSDKSQEKATNQKIDKTNFNGIRANGMKYLRRMHKLRKSEIF